MLQPGMTVYWQGNLRTVNGLACVVESVSDGILIAVRPNGSKIRDKYCLFTILP